jgi:hypothetical protein
MDHQFLLPVMYKGVEVQFEARAQVWAYGRRFFVLVNGQEVLFERDDQGEIRGILAEGSKGKPPDGELLRAVAEAVGEIM